MVDRSNNKNKSYQANDVAQPYHKRDVNRTTMKTSSLEFSQAAFGRCNEFSSLVPCIKGSNLSQKNDFFLE